SSSSNANAGTAGAAAGATGTAASTPTGPSTCASYQTPLTGAVTMAGVAPDLPALANFLDRLGKPRGDKDPDFSTVTLGHVQRSTVGDVDVVTFTINATLGTGVRSDRLEHYFKGALCK